ncbi:hypothetical protein BS78_07G065200 [Paspalum vaginatum]|nr:hypothetical protein BS78_07G065200 [Paspalum vaginatum]
MHESQQITDSQFTALFREEAANIAARYPACMWGMDLTTVVDCCLYRLLLQYHLSGHSNIGFVGPAHHAPSYWICDGIIQGDKAWEISNAFHPETSLERDASVLHHVFRKLKEDPRSPPFLVVSKDDDPDVYKEMSYCRWIFFTLKKNKKVHEGMKTIFARASSIFLAFETIDNPSGLPNSFFKECSNLGVLVLSCCAFSFASPPFVHCPTLRFLGLDQCTDDRSIINVVEHEGVGRATSSKWGCLQSLWVIDLYCTDWVEILSKENLELMENLRELNIERVRWPWWWASHRLQQILPKLQRLRIIRPVYDEATETASSDTVHAFLVDGSSLEVLDLSSNDKGIGRNLLASISMASHPQVLILDGCHVLEDVVVSNNSSLRSFSFDGYGQASQRTSTVELPTENSRPKHPPDTTTNNKSGLVKTSMISLKGCTRLDKLFLRGILNLEELDLSGCAIKVLDFGAMVVDVPRLKRLFLLGCEHLHAIAWGNLNTIEQLELIHIDTRPGSSRRLPRCARPPSIGTQQKSFRLQVHATTADARLGRSLYAPIKSAMSDGCYFNISITSSVASSDGAVRSDEATISNKDIDGEGRHVVDAAGQYSDVFTKVGDGQVPMEDFPHPPTRQLDRHVGIGDGSRSVQSEVDLYSDNNLGTLMRLYTESVHVHDVLTSSNTVPKGSPWVSLVWCRVERCPNLRIVFPRESEDYPGTLETMWASDLPVARCLWSKCHFRGRFSFGRFRSLRQLCLRRCPSLEFGLEMGSRPSFPSLETLHIIHCGGLKHVFAQVEDEQHRHHRSVESPRLTTIHLHDAPALQQICETTEMVAPALETIKIRGCWSLRRLPALKGREPGTRKPTVEIERDVWDTLEWDGVGSGHHAALYEAAPVHSRCSNRRRMLRGTVLR